MHEPANKGGIRSVAVFFLFCLLPVCSEAELCNPNPCRNGGTCGPDGTCNCTGTGFVGANCTDVRITETKRDVSSAMQEANGDVSSVQEADNDPASVQEAQAKLFDHACPHSVTVVDYVYREVAVPDLSGHSLVFAVRACKDAHVAISAGTDLGQARSMAEVVIGAGGNTYQKIGDCKLCSIGTTSGALLSCDDFRKFWMRWTVTASGTQTDVSMGTGISPGNAVIMTSTLSFPLSVQHVWVASYGTTGTGTWVFDFPEQTDFSACPTTTEMTTQMTTELTTEMTTQMTTQMMTTTPEPTTTTPVATTTTPPQPTGTAAPLVFLEYPKCRCAQVIIHTPAQQVEMAEKAVEAATELRRNLTVAATDTSKSQRKKSSAEDARGSAQTVGYVGVAMLVLVLVLCVVPDLISIGIWLHDLVEARRRKVPKLSPDGAAGPTDSPASKLLARLQNQEGVLVTRRTGGESPVVKEPPVLQPIAGPSTAPDVVIPAPAVHVSEPPLHSGIPIAKNRLKGKTSQGPRQGQTSLYELDLDLDLMTSADDESRSGTASRSSAPPGEQSQLQRPKTHRAWTPNKRWTN